jgi:uncharacterized protein (TIGR00255 family)
MILSMTGFGAGRARSGDEEISVEIRSVNHKHCEVKVRMPQELAALEAELVRQIRSSVHRGALEVWVKRTVAGRSALIPRVDRALAREYVAALDAVAQELSLPRDLGVAELAQVDGIVTLESRDIDLDAVRQAAEQACALALAGLHAMREREGAKLAEDLIRRLSALKAESEQVAALAPASVEHYRARLEARVAELARGMPVEPQRLAQEVALFADRVDIAEELTRLSSHLLQLNALAQASEPAGRRMDFLVQELHREVNTLGAKSQSAQIAQRVVTMKAEIERIREQVQNVE